MKFFSPLTILFFSMSLTAFGQSGADFSKLSWLEGKWTRTNARPGRSGYEVWERVSATEWKGRGIMLKGADTTLVEKVRLKVENGSIYYIADVPENKKPVSFKIVEISDKGFVSENPAHDFPKRIEYWYDGTTLKATISGDGKSIDYLFQKQ
jgi:hypothetical protein